MRYAVGALIVNQGGNILFCATNPKPSRSLYGWISRFIEEVQVDKEAILRVIEEETGLKIPEKSCTRHFYKKVSLAEEEGIMWSIFRCSIENDGDIGKNEKLLWCSTEEIKDMIPMIEHQWLYWLREFGIVRKIGVPLE